MKKLIRSCLTVIGLAAIVIIVIVVVSSGGDSEETKPAPVGRTMYFCGLDRCRNSGEYGKLVFSTGINVWNNPDPNRGGVHHQASHGQKVTVIKEQLVNSGSGGLWYKLEGGGWTNDLWLTDKLCTKDSLNELSLDDC